MTGHQKGSSTFKCTICLGDLVLETMPAGRKYWFCLKCHGEFDYIERQ